MEPPSEFLVHGSGPAAALAAARLARARLSVRWDEGVPEPDESGEGELLPSTLLARLPGPSNGIPPRRVAVRRWLLLDGQRYSAVEYREPTSAASSVAVLRSELTAWCREEAKSAGAILDRVESSEEPLTPATAAARSGSSTAGTSGDLFSELPEPYTQRTLETGAREWYSCARYELPPERIDSRFALAPDEGAVIAALSAPQNGVGSGGHLRTYRGSVGVGVLVWGVRRLVTRAELATAEAAFREHPAVAPYLTGAQVRKSTVRPISPPPPDRWGGPGYLRIGRGAGIEGTNGMEPRGLAAELASAEIAAEVAASALRSGPRLGTRSPEYRRRLGADPVYRGFQDWTRLGARLKSTAKVWAGWPGFAAESFERLMTETGAPKRSVRRTLEEVRRARRLSRPALLRSAWNWWEGF
ncbi:MAG: hypothetical protein L3K07_02760 [Thermoplasmata archaeon]|nr:hypothetical protein [Thermoplasmata archaeon]